MQQRLPSLLDRPIAFAHRGARAHAPENTLEAFDLAVRLGATGVESDVWLTVDGICVLDHDGVVRRGVRKRPIGTLRHAELPGHIPTLTEMLDRCDDGIHVSLDLKDPACGPAVLGLLRERTERRRAATWLCHPELDVLLPLRGAGVRLVQSTRLDRIKEGPERRAATLAASAIDGINLHHTDWNGGLVTLFHRFDRVAFGWDLQYPHLLRSALRMGLDAVFSDHVDVMMDSYREELGNPSS